MQIYEDFQKTYQRVLAKNVKEKVDESTAENKVREFQISGHKILQVKQLSLKYDF